MNIQDRLRRLEQLANRRDAGSVVLTFADGTTRQTKAEDAIPLLCSPEGENIVDISG